MKSDISASDLNPVLVVQNPKSLAPYDIINSQQIILVNHHGFDGEIYQGSIIVHKEVVKDVSDFFTLAYEIGFVIEKIIPISDEKYGWDDELSMADNNTSGFNYRAVMGTDRLSNHAMGLAFDVNPKQNIYLRHDRESDKVLCYPKGAKYDEGAKGTLTGNHPLVNFMKERGWQWGGDWKIEDGVVDYQHFEKKINLT